MTLFGITREIDDCGNAIYKWEWTAFVWVALIGLILLMLGVKGC